MAQASLFMDIIAKDSASSVFNRIGGAAAGLGRATDRANKSQTAANRTWQTTKRLLLGLGTSYAAYKIGQFAKQSVAAASALQEQVTATEAVFGKNSKTMRLWADGATAAFGQSRREALQYSNSFGTLANSIGLGDRKQMSFSKSLTKLSSDMASFKNTTIQEAAEALQSGLVGETEPLRRFGIFLNDAKLKAKAFEMGLSDGKSVLDEHAKALAAYEIIMETAQRTNMKGDFARTANNYANQVRVLQSNVENLKAVLGKPLMGAANEAFAGFNETLPQLEKVLGSKGADKVFRDFGKSIGDAARWVATHTDEIKSTLSTLGDALGRIGGAAKRVWDVFASLPPGVQETLTTLSMAGVALGKIPGLSSVGKGLVGGALKAMNVNAGVVNVNGKVAGPSGTPGAGKPGALGATGTALFSGMLTPVLVGTIVSALAAAGVYQGLKNKYGVDTPEGTSKWIDATRNRNLGRGSDRGLGMGYRSERTQMRDIADAAKEATGAAGRLVTQIRLLPKSAKEAAAEANKVAAAVKKAADQKAVKITVKGAKRAANDAENVANRLKRIQSKDARVTARGARQAAADAVNVANKLRDIPDAKPQITVEKAQAIAAIAQVTANLAAVQSKTISLNVVRNETTRHDAAGGYILGPGTATSDSIPAMLSNGEFVIRAAAVQKYGVSTFHRLNAMGFKDGGEATPYQQAKRDANWQKRLAKFISKYYLSADEADWLSSLDRKPARRFMKHPKRIGKFARRAGSVGAYRSALDAQKSYDAMLADMGFDAMDAGSRQATLNQRIAEAQKDASSKNPVKRAKAYEKLQTLQQKLADTQQEIADAQAAAAEKERAAQETVRAAIEETASSYRSFASIATTSVDDVSAAQDKLTEAQNKVTEARRKFDLAGNDRDRAAAARELADAEKNLTTAQKERNNVSDKVTGNSIRANMGSKLTRLRDFAAAVKTLKNQGLNAVTLADILQMGPDQGYEYAKALLDGGIGDINSLQSQITSEAASLGLFTAGVNAVSATTVGQANAAAAGMDINLVPAPVTLNLDGQAIATALLQYQRQSGG